MVGYLSTVGGRRRKLCGAKRLLNWYEEEMEKVCLKLKGSHASFIRLFPSTV